MELTRKCCTVYAGEWRAEALGIYFHGENRVGNIFVGIEFVSQLYMAGLWKLIAAVKLNIGNIRCYI